MDRLFSAIRRKLVEHTRSPTSVRMATILSEPALAEARAFVVPNPHKAKEAPLDQRFARYPAFREKGGISTSDVKPIPREKVGASHFFIARAAQF